MQRKKLMRELARANGKPDNGSGLLNAPMLDFLGRKVNKRRRRQTAFWEKMGDPKALARMAQAEKDEDRLEVLYCQQQLLEKHEKRRLERLDNMGVREIGSSNKWKARPKSKRFIGESIVINKIHGVLRAIVNKMRIKLDNLRGIYPEIRILHKEVLALTEKIKSANMKRGVWIEITEETASLCKEMKKISGNETLSQNPWINSILQRRDVHYWVKAGNQCGELLRKLEEPINGAPSN